MGKKQLTTDEFITRAAKIHNNYYDYSKTNYINTKTKVIIIDPIYGEFKQIPSNHLKGHGNIKRRDSIRSKQNRKNKFDIFIKKAKEIHGDLYDYSKVIYINCDTKVIIIDPIYGDFEITPYCHINRKTGHIKRRKNSIEVMELRKIDFIKKSIELYGIIHDFSKFIYSGSKKDTIFYDKKYGSYITKPINHLRYNSYHQQRKLENKNLHETEKDHIIPISIICSAKERGKKIFRDRPLFKLLNSYINFVTIPTSDNRKKNDYILYKGSRISAKSYRNNYDVIKDVIIEKLHLSETYIDDIIYLDKKYLNKILKVEII